MKRDKSRNLIKQIKNGEEDVLLYLFKRHYPTIKKIFSSYNFREKDIPSLVADVVVKVWMETHRNSLSENIDLTSYLLNTARENAKQLAAERKAIRKHKGKDLITEPAPADIIAECVNILDERSRKVLEWRYAESHTIEQLAEELKMDAATTQDFINKSFEKLSSIVKIRMEFNS